MSTLPNGFCGNCGLARPPQAATCPRCGMPYEAAQVDFESPHVSLQAPTQVATTPPESLWQLSAPTSHAGGH